MPLNDRTGILLVNLGTPDSMEVRDVRKYLREFLLDPRVIDIPALPRNMLVRGIIAPFRAPRSAVSYRKIWMQDGSPLLVYGRQLQHALQQHLGDTYRVELAMRYQNPSIEAGLDALQKAACADIVVVPLFPQYASATTGSVIEKVMRCLSERTVIPSLRFTSPFFDAPGFLAAFAAAGKRCDPENFAHFLFSFHGLPERQVHRTSPHNDCLENGCCADMHPGNMFCYRAQCFATARGIARLLNIPEEKYTVCFQSRLGKTPWIGPYTAESIRALAENGIKRVLVFSPAFVADCLETVYEIGIEYAGMFRQAGGEELTLVPGLNASEEWVHFLATLIKS